MIAPLIVIGIIVFLVMAYFLGKRFATHGRLRRVIDRTNELIQRLSRVYVGYKNKMKITVYGASRRLADAHTSFT